jgi:hypothetical protein
MIPDFRDDGYLPEGLHLAIESEVILRFGTATRRRRSLSSRLSRWIQLARDIGARRLLVDGSFVTVKTAPNDIDAAVLLPEDFEYQISNSDPAALELATMFVTHQPGEIFAAGDEVAWEDWVDHFSQTRHRDRRRKGIVEVEL